MTDTERKLAERAAERRRSAVPRYRDEIRRVFDRLRDDPADTYHDDAERREILDVLLRWRLAEVGAPPSDVVRGILLETLTQWIEYGYRTVQALIRDGVSPELLADAAACGREAVILAAFAGFPEPGSRAYLRVLIEREIRTVGAYAKQAAAEGRTAVAGAQWFDAVSLSWHTTIERIHPDAALAWKRRHRDAEHTMVWTKTEREEVCTKTEREEVVKCERCCADSITPVCQTCADRAELDVV